MNSRDQPSYNKHVDFSFSKNFPRTQVLKLTNAVSLVPNPPENRNFTPYLGML